MRLTIAWSINGLAPGGLSSFCRKYVHFLSSSAGSFCISPSFGRNDSSKPIEPQAWLAGLASSQIWQVNVPPSLAVNWNRKPFSPIGIVVCFSALMLTGCPLAPIAATQRCCRADWVLPAAWAVLSRSRKIRVTRRRIVESPVVGQLLRLSYERLRFGLEVRIYLCLGQRVLQWVAGRVAPNCCSSTSLCLSRPCLLSVDASPA